MLIEVSVRLTKHVDVTLKAIFELIEVELYRL